MFCWLSTMSTIDSQRCSVDYQRCLQLTLNHVLLITNGVYHWLDLNHVLLILNDVHYWVSTMCCWFSTMSTIESQPCAVDSQRWPLLSLNHVLLILNDGHYWVSTMLCWFTNDVLLITLWTKARVSCPLSKHLVGSDSSSLTAKRRLMWGMNEWRG